MGLTYQYDMAYRKSPHCLIYITNHLIRIVEFTNRAQFFKLSSSLPIPVTLVPKERRLIWSPFHQHHLLGNNILHLIVLHRNWWNWIQKLPTCLVLPKQTKVFGCGCIRWLGDLRELKEYPNYVVYGEV